jgi:hypothetical protein
VCNATAASFPLSKYTRGGDSAPAFSGLCVYLQFTWEVGLLPSLWSFPPTATFTSFPAPHCCWVCAAVPALSCWLVYLQVTWEVGLPPCPVEFFSHCHFYKLSHSWLLGVCHLSCFLQLACCEGFPLPPLQRSGHPALFAMCLFVVIAYYSVFFFFPWVGSVFPEAMLILPRVVCGSTECRLAHLVVHDFPSHLDAGVWRQHGSPPGFSV